MKEYEKEILSVVREAVVNGIKGLSSYNSPFSRIAESVANEHAIEIKEILNNCMKDVLSDGEFKAEIRKVIGQKVVREFANQAESCIARTVQKLKQDETFRARLTIAIDDLLKEYERK